MLLLALYLALFPALTAVITSRLVQWAGPRALLLVPAVWVSTEYLRGYLFGGFPWVPLGNSQVTVLPVAQLASVTGVYGLSALVAFVNGALAWGVLSRAGERLAAVAAAVLVVASVGTWGAMRIADGSLARQGTPVRIGLIQGNIAQEDKWNPSEARRIFTTYIAMTRDAVRRGAEFVIWPESSTPFMFEEDPVGGEMLRSLAREVRVPILFGSDQVDRSGDAIRLFNSAFLLTPDGSTAAVYRKIHLVPFGEYIPLKEWLYFVSPLVERLAEFAPGTSTVMLPIGGHNVTFAIRFCRGARCSRRSRMTGGTAIRRRPISTSRWRRCAPSSRAGTSRGPPTRASAASSIPTAGCCSGRRSSNRSGWWGRRGS
jgi:apolipoprotein N-acyltransferase